LVTVGNLKKGKVVVFDGVAHAGPEEVGVEGL
jgi:hypothetical protein